MDKARNIFERIWGKAHNTDQNQWKVIAMCILGATTFWFFSALNKQDYSSNINYPISIEYPGKDSLLVVGELPSAIRLNVTGGGWNLFRKSFGIGVKPIEVRLDKPTETNYLLGAALMSTVNEQVKSFSLNRILTDTLHFHIESRLVRSIVLAVDPADLDLADDHILIDDITIVPDSIGISGPASYINNLADTFYLEINQAGINENYQETLTMPGEMEQVSWSDGSIDVQFSVDPLVPASLTLPVTLVNFPTGYHLQTPRHLSVSYQIPVSYADSIDANMVVLYADFQNLTTDSVLVPEARSNHPYISNLSAERVELKITHEN